MLRTPLSDLLEFPPLTQVPRGQAARVQQPTGSLCGTPQPLVTRIWLSLQNAPAQTVRSHVNLCKV